MTTEEQTALADELGATLDAESGEGGPGEYIPNGEPDPDPEPPPDADQWANMFKGAFLAVATLRGYPDRQAAHVWPITDAEALHLSAVTAEAFPSAKMPPKLQLLNALITVLGARVLAEMQAAKAEPTTVDADAQVIDDNGLGGVPGE